MNARKSKSIKRFLKVYPDEHVEKLFAIKEVSNVLSQELKPNDSEPTIKRTNKL